ncbi:protein kinase domain containing protein [Entamoeba histolytica HM-1:IMSS-B]|uniref:Protein kinase domain containing protein n=6 Tax=Entamoeba histolytica TaxID=5759 RepID=C4LTL5_ENTH1|nr:protein kinase domain containing protein [Entamoeba histolytica HM-1:IMSS]EMD43243.1 serine/threonine protein kinase, putative [Entamoeba histolytica KU27]EMH76347.1 protein kinase domain containing protein [Entamoeba histolytica HM-1:IMSS-B]ENY61841.1 serine-threonine protein kinase, putative [Entamoeba histolytica HM-1:IMSS-A]GAT91908.1 protein kinase domain containing protein [Entamoeba histolytica]EAL50802.1 protein kinase domain containing protein [Entamoeba histolytica HM-1:IMSS]|eukprot:XP_656186.1 protein kinase domain containing protein [Entamoeba histolytica HM-1:IMSS]
MIVLILLQLFYTGFSQYNCSVGCGSSSNCIAEYTCPLCLEGYEQDGSCFYCDNDNLDSTSTTLNVMTVNGCEKRSLVYDGDNIPTDVIELKLDERYTYTFTKDKPYRKAPCGNGGYVQGFWVKFDSKAMENDTIYLDFTVTDLNGEEDSVDYTMTINIISQHHGNKLCVGQSSLGSVLYPHFQMPKQMFMNDDTIYYYFFSLTEEVDLKFSFCFTESETERVRYYISGDNLEMLAEVKRTGTVQLPLASEGYFGYPVCMPHIFGKMIDLEYEFNISAVMLMTTKRQNRILYVEEYEWDENDDKQCVQFWNYVTVNGNIGIFLLVQPSHRVRKFTFITQEHNLDIYVSLRVICPNNCHNDIGNGYCSISEEKCICKEGYGGSDCHLLCYYNNQWQPSTNKGDNQCYFGSSSCSENCLCEDGYVLVNHRCISYNCTSRIKDETIECFNGDINCDIDCKCKSGYKLFNEKCILETCGNGMRDEGEDCDGGEYCNEFCKCQSNKYIPSSNIQQSCQPKISSGTIAGIVCGCCAVLFIIILIIIIFIIYKFSHSIQLLLNDDIWKSQQPPYYMYISGSKRYSPEVSKSLKFSITPLSLDFGRSEIPTEIFETRYQEIHVKNLSKRKDMMIIFHTPNNPKYVFHFNPQVKILGPKRSTDIVVFMTLHCTTKIKNVCIPYTVWFSKSRRYLNKIVELLKEKTFNDWSQSDQLQMEKELKNIPLHCHGNFVIATEAASSTHIDMDELNISEEPIAEGAMGKVYIGEYRSVPVAIKVFRWENLTEEEMNDLKNEVINECEVMSKLRNPFIANYIGSITYIPQISMVTQFFILGSLGEYLRKNKPNYLRLPYKLKIRMLFDTARGMEFLHENRIMHLDLKPDNLLVNSLYTDSSCCIKITDFGTSRFTKKTNNLTDKGLGTPIYLAPECYHDHYTFAGDVYSFAITAWEIFYQDEPYKEFKSLFDIKRFVENGERLKIDMKMPQPLKILITECWAHSFEDRPQFSEVCDKMVNVIENVGEHGELDEGIDVNDIEQFIQQRTEKFELFKSNL